MTQIRISHSNWFKNCGNSPASANYMKIRSKKPENRSDTSSDKSNSDSEITANFELVDPRKNHYHGIRALLSRLFVGFNLDLSTLVNQIIHQSDASSVLIQDYGGETVFGIICALSLTPALLFNERFVNIPEIVGSTMCQSLRQRLTPIDDSVDVLVSVDAPLSEPLADPESLPPPLSEPEDPP
ncbi:hypothetical protein MXB_4191 [Myxobolus squamalis]|nr:hypothetical protein MXB_4191 [Myxobolus squamalis]